MAYGNPASLAALQGLSSVSNMNPTGDAYYNKRRSQILSGQDEAFAPSEADLIDAQQARGGSISRDMLRDKGINENQAVQQAADAAAMQKLQQLIMPEQIKGAYASDAATRNQMAADTRAQTQQNAADARTQRTIDAADQRQQAGFGQQVSLQEDAQAAALARDAANRKPLVASQGALTNLGKAQQNANGFHPLEWLYKQGGGTGRSGSQEQLRQALVPVLQQQGDLQIAQEAAAALAKYPGATYEQKKAAAMQDPRFDFDLDSADEYSQQFIKLTVGQ